MFVRKGIKSSIVLFFLLVLTVSFVSAYICHDENYIYCETVATASDCTEIFNATAPANSCDEGCLCKIYNTNDGEGTIEYRIFYNFLNTQTLTYTYNFDPSITSLSACITDCETQASQTQCTVGTAATTACYCGSTQISTGDFCCQTPEGLQQQTSQCTPFCAEGEITSTCYCGTTTESNGFCCGGSHQTTLCSPLCPPGEITDAGCQCGNNVATQLDVGDYCCNGVIQDTDCSFDACLENVDLSTLIEDCWCGDDFYTDLLGTKYCCNDALQDDACPTPSGCTIDGIVGADEQCDPLSTDYTKCPGATDCTDTCTCVMPIGCDRPSDQWECSSSNPTCASANDWCLEDLCTCVPNSACNDATCFPPPCDGSNPPENKPQIQDVAHQQGIPELTVSWTYDDTCEQDVQEFYIYENDAFKKAVPATEFQTDIDIYPTPDKPTMCYKVQARYENTFSEKSDEVCRQLGDPECYDNPEDRCIPGDDGRLTRILTCTDENVYEPLDCATNQICIDSGNGVGCKFSNYCPDCNSGYQTFGYEGTTLDENGNEVECSDPEVSCYKEYVWIGDVPSSTPMYLSCIDVDECGDFNSELACNIENVLHCGIPNCAWQEINSQTGVGYCKDTQNTGSQCDLCNDLENKNPLFLCDQTTCPTFGECYYSTKKAGGTCLSKEEMICEYYNGENDCSTTLNIDALYEDVEGEWTRTEGSNAVITQSVDNPFSLGKCKWDADVTQTVDKCFKDSDGNHIMGGSIFNSRDYQGDKNAPENKDFDNPITTIGISNEQTNPTKTGREVFFPIGAVDEKSDIKYTHVCIYAQGEQECYPMSADYIDTAQQAITGTFPNGGIYNLKYYSEDEGSNIEEVQEGYFEVINDSPVIEVSYDYTTQEIGEDTYYSDLNVAVDIKTQSGAPLEALCTGEFQGDAVPGPATISGAYGDHFDLEYVYVPDNHYLFVITCADAFGNEATKEEWIIVDGDKSITNIKPWPPQTYQTVNGVQISFDSLALSNCKLSPTATSYDSMEYTATTSNGYNHTYSLPDLDTGVYKYYLACQEQGGGEVTEGRPGDYIEFAVDKLPPISILLNHAGETFDFDAQIDDTFEIKFGCNDNRAQLIVDGINWNAGCADAGASIYYKFNTMTIFEQYHNQPFTKTLDDSPIEIYSVDGVGNQELSQTIILSIRDVVDPTVQGFSYYKP